MNNQKISCIQNTGSEVLCTRETTLMVSEDDRVWESSAALLAPIANSGLITAVSKGEPYFTFTSVLNGCTILMDQYSYIRHLKLLLLLKKFV